MSHPGATRRAGRAPLVGLLLGVGARAKEENKPKEPDRLPDVSLSRPEHRRERRPPPCAGRWWRTVGQLVTPCRKELPFFQAYAEKYAGKVDVVGIDFQETHPDRAKKMARESGGSTRSTRTLTASCEPSACPR